MCNQSSPIDAAIYFIYHKLSGSDGELDSFCQGLCAAVNDDYAKTAYQIINSYENWIYELGGDNVRTNPFFIKYRITLTRKDGTKKEFITTKENTRSRIYSHFDKSDKYSGYSCDTN